MDNEKISPITPGPLEEETPGQPCPSCHNPYQSITLHKNYQGEKVAYQKVMCTSCDNFNYFAEQMKF